MCAGPKAMFSVATAIAAQRSALATVREFVAGPPGADDELKREVETTS